MGAAEALAAFRNHDFVSDESWNTYLHNLEIPPGRESAVLPRFKAKWYKANIDPTFDTSLVTGTPPASSPATPSEQHTNAAPQPDGTRHTENKAEQPPLRRPPPAAGPSTQGASAWLRQRPGPQDALFVLHVALLVLGLAAAQPLMWALSARAWRCFLTTSALTHAYKVYLVRGFPPLRRPYLASLSGWALPVAGTTDAQYLIMSVLFLQSRPLALMVVPIWVVALYHAFAYAAQRFGGNALWRRYGAVAHSFLSANQGQALVLNAFAEIGVGFLLLLGLLSPARSILLTLIYWKNVLPVRYHSPDAASYHRQAWSAINSRAAPLLQAVPLLRVPIDFMRRQFENPR